MKFEKNKLADELEIIAFACSIVGKDGEMIPEFTEEEMDRIRGILEEVPRYKLPRGLYGMKGIEAQRYRYLVEQYYRLNYYNTTCSIKNRYAYFFELIEKDACDDNC